jgi:hypothetical protein
LLRLHGPFGFGRVFGGVAWLALASGRRALGSP